MTYIEKILYIVGEDNLGIHLPKDVDKHYSKYEDYDFVVINEDLDKCYQEIIGYLDNKLKYNKSSIEKHIKSLI